MEDRSESLAIARIGASATVGALVLQFILGMYTNLYVAFSPVQSLGSGGMTGGGMMGAMSQAMSGSTVLMLHMMLGWLLLILASLALIGAVIARRPRATLFATLGMGAIAVAGYGGLRFLVTGQDGYSFVMAVGFIAAVGSYFGEAVALR